MFIAVCYDIPDNRRRTKMSNILKGYGNRVQRSVFECDITPEHFEKMKQRLGKVLAEGDGLRYYVLCSGCLKKIEVAGGAPVNQTQLYYAV